MLASYEEIDAALLDVSLGRETSAAIADRLLARTFRLHLPPDTRTASCSLSIFARFRN